MNQIKNIKNKAVNDLVWLISSPPLIASSEIYPNADYFQKLWIENEHWISELYKKPKPLYDFLSERKTFQLGRYCENLLTYFFIHSPYYELLENNLQISDKNTTHGEIDFLVKEMVTGEIIHIELAVKFYIYNKNSNNIIEFIGPNGNDRLDLKIKKINQQINFIQDYPKFFENYEKPINIQKRIFFKGFLFYGESDSNANKILNEQHLRGKKITCDSNYNLPKHSSYYFPHKLEWLTAPSDAAFDEYPIAIEKIKEQLKNRNAVLIYEKNGQKVSKHFIVNPTWPM